MNFLAHAYLSFNRPAILVGNMISDFVKGKSKYNYPIDIQKGIALHRAIDTFTDDHPVTREAKQYFKQAVGLYSGAFIDVVYDHFLANDPYEFEEETLHHFTQQTYRVLTQHADDLPPLFSQMLPYMIEQNWLYNYRNRWGAEKSFGGVVRRAKYLDSSAEVAQLFNEHYHSLQKCYNEFFPLLKQFAAGYIETL